MYLQFKSYVQGLYESEGCQHKPHSELHYFTIIHYFVCLKSTMKTTAPDLEAVIVDVSFL